MKKFLTFGGGSQKFRDASIRLGREAINTEVFDEVIALTDNDLQTSEHLEFQNQFGEFIENHPRGYGYWIWKPYLIFKTMTAMKNGDMLVYADSGCEFGDLKVLEEIFLELAQKNNKEIIFNHAWHTMLPFTSSIARSYFDPQDKFSNKPMYEAGLLAIKVTELTRAFIKDWYLACSNTSLLKDPVRDNEPASFLDHRHDQALFSLVMYTKYPVLLFGDMSGYWNQAIVPKRIRHGRSNKYFFVFSEGAFSTIPYEEFDSIECSSYDEPYCTSDDPKNLITFDVQKRDFNFHTKAEKNPSVVFKFLKEVSVSVMVVENRETGQDRLKNLTIEALVGDSYQKIAEIYYTFGGFYDESPAVFALPYGFKAKQIRVSTTNAAEEFFHLKSVYFYR